MTVLGATGVLASELYTDKRKNGFTGLTQRRLACEYLRIAIRGRSNEQLLLIDQSEPRGLLSHGDLEAVEVQGLRVVASDD